MKKDYVRGLAKVLEREADSTYEHINDHVSGKRLKQNLLDAADVCRVYPFPNLEEMESKDIDILRSRCACELHSRKYKRDWNYIDCHKPYGIYLIKDELWKSIGLPNNRGFLCIECCAKRIGRPLTVDDLKDVLCNDVLLYFTEKS